MTSGWSREQVKQAKAEARHLATITLSGKYAITDPYQGGRVSVSAVIGYEDAERVVAALNRICGVMPASSRYSIVDREKLRDLLASTGMSHATISSVLTELEK